MNEKAKIIYKSFGIKRLNTPSKLTTTKKCSASKKMQAVVS
jgi:hypothetical protein